MFFYVSCNIKLLAVFFNYKQTFVFLRFSPAVVYEPLHRTLLSFIVVIVFSDHVHVLSLRDRSSAAHYTGG